MRKYHFFLLAVFSAVWVWAAIDPVYPHDWLLENYLVFIAVPLIIILGRYFKLSDISYTLITIFLVLHVIGSHYTYAEVPFGYTLQDWLGASRNMYDRLVHFSFGLLWAYPLREVFMRVAKVRGFWGYYLPLDVVAALSALYEVIEWRVAAKVDMSAGLAFLGAQGDVWDAQKDMALAMLGAICALTIVALIRWRWDPNFVRELIDSFRLSKNDEPLGEVKLRELMDRKREPVRTSRT